jgi:urease accessory protein
MLRATEVLEALAPADDSLTLPFELRQRSRLVARTDAGRELLLQVPRGGVLRHGALLRVSDGTVLEVRAAPESLSMVESQSAVDLLRAAYHLGNRHVALQIDARGLRYLHDHVLDAMLIGLGLEPRALEAPFEPEHGAYGHAHGAHPHGAHPHGAHPHDAQPHDAQPHGAHGHDHD